MALKSWVNEGIFMYGKREVRSLSVLVSTGSSGMSDIAQSLHKLFLSKVVVEAAYTCGACRRQ